MKINFVIKNITSTPPNTNTHTNQKSPSQKHIPSHIQTRGRSLAPQLKWSPNSKLKNAWSPSLYLTITMASKGTLSHSHRYHAPPSLISMLPWLLYFYLNTYSYLLLLCAWEGGIGYWVYGIRFRFRFSVLNGHFSVSVKYPIFGFGFKWPFFGFTQISRFGFRF